MMYDVLIIGAGIEGSAAGYNLVKNEPDKRIVILEQFDAIHTRGSSHGGSRMIHNAHHELFQVKLVDMAYGMWRQLEEDSGKQLLIENGCLGFGKHSVTEFHKKVTANGVESQLLSGKEVNEKYPKQLKLPDDYSCVFVHKSGMIRASHALATLQELFVKNGGKLLIQHKVIDINPDGPIVTVVTEGGDSFQAKRVIVTAGPWTKDLMQITGLELPLKIWRTEALYWSAENPEHFAAETFPTFLYINEEEYFDFYGLPINEYSGLLRIAYHSGPEINDPDMRDQIPESKTSETVSDFIQKHFIGIKKNLAVMETCMYTVTPDFQPIIDRHPTHPNIVIGTGFSGRGFKWAPIVGKLLSQLALEQAPSLDIAPFRIDRFASVKQ